MVRRNWIITHKCLLFHFSGNLDKRLSSLYMCTHICIQGNIYIYIYEENYLWKKETKEMIWPSLTFWRASKRGFWCFFFKTCPRQWRRRSTAKEIATITLHTTATTHVGVYSSVASSSPPISLYLLLLLLPLQFILPWEKEKKRIKRWVGNGGFDMLMVMHVRIWKDNKMFCLFFFTFLFARNYININLML